MPNTTSSAAWKPALRELETILTRTSEKFDVLRKIDHSISKPNWHLDHLLHYASDLLCKPYGIKAYGLFYGVDNSLLPIREGSTSIDKKHALKAYSAARKKDYLKSKPTPVWQSDDRYFVFLIPLAYGSDVFLVFELPPHVSDRKDFHAFASNFAEQIHSFTQYVLYRRRREAQRVAYHAFFDNKLQPKACWAALLGTLHLFLPDEKFGQITPAPLTQLLTYIEGDTALRIAAGEGSHGSSFVLVDESVSGLLLRDRKTDFLLIDPTEQALLYKGYGHKHSRTELVIRLESDDGAVGVLNIEHEQANAFNSMYVECMRDAARFLAPLVTALQARYDSFRKKEIGLLYIFTDMLSRMGDTYGHLVSQPILAARGAMAEMRYLVEHHSEKEVSKQLIEEVDRLGRSIDELESHSEQFTKGLPEFISYGSQPIRQRIENRLKSFKKKAAAENIELHIVENEPNLCSFATSLFQEHIFNIVNNSFQQVRKRIFEDAQESGWIKIEIAKTTGITPQDQKTGLDFVDVKISDNGGGASKADFRRIGRPGFTTKKEFGSGFGVAAAKEYFESIGGEMTWQNIRNGFATTIRMQEFRPGIHKETRVIDRIREEAMK